VAGISKFEPFHGPVLYRLISDIANSGSSLIIKKGISRNSYLISLVENTNSSKEVGIFIKYSAKKRSPWRYTIYEEEQHEVELLNEVCSETFFILVNGLEDGVACLTYQNLKEILDNDIEEVEWISVKRRLNTEYKVEGKDGKLRRRIPRNLFPGIVMESLEDNKIVAE